MHVFCDESGGLDSRKLLLVAALGIEPTIARTVVGRFKKRQSWRGELKGHDMSDRLRAACLDLLFEHDIEVAVAVCDARTPVGSWVAKELCESRVYGGLLESAVLEVLRPPFGRTGHAVTADGGRYTQAVENEERRRIDPVLRPHLTPRPPIASVLTFEPSDTVAGLQLCDVVANFTYSNLAQARDATSGTDALRTVFTGAPSHGKARVFHAAFGEECPAWLFPDY